MCVCVCSAYDCVINNSVVEFGVIQPESAIVQPFPVFTLFISVCKREKEAVERDKERENKKNINTPTHTNCIFNDVAINKLMNK